MGNGHARDVSRPAPGSGSAATPSILARSGVSNHGAAPMAASPLMASPAPGTLQRQAAPDAETDMPGMDAASGSGAKASAPCIEAVTGEDPTTLTEAGVVTIVEFGATWCGPCKMLQASLEEMCQRFKTEPPKAPVRIFSIDIDAPGNEEIAKRYTDSSVPHLYFYVGGKQKAHYNDALQPDILDSLVAEYTSEASQSGAFKGFKSGAGWGTLAGGLTGIAASIVVGTQSGLEGNAMIGAILGTIGGGALAGFLVGGGIGALVGAASEEKKGSRRKKKKAPKRRDGAATTDRDELEADAMAARVLQRSGSGAASSGAESPGHGAMSGAPLDAGLRLDMESQFGRDFSHVRLHRDDGASRVADSMQAYAVTEGSDIYFARDGFAPHTPGGRGILAHELTHVAQQDVSGPSAPTMALEAEAARASADVARGGGVTVSQAAGGDAPPLPMTRGEQTGLGIGVGTVGGAAVGAGIGAIAAAATGGSVGEAAGIGALIGAGAGLIAGFFAGFFARRTSRVGAPEADALIRRRYGKYLPQGVPAPLRDAIIRPVSASELSERFACRHQSSPDGNLIGWTDTGAPWAGARPPAQTVPSQAAEPTCNGKQLDHATPERPVIYFQNDTPDAGILVHEGLHAVSHPEFQRLHNYVNEGVTELYTRRLLADVNIAVYGGGYDDNVRDITPFEQAVGEEPLAHAYFGGDVAGLDKLMTPVYGPCSLLEWALSQEANKGGSSSADAVLANRGVDYCAHVNSLMRIPPGTPGGLNAPPLAPPAAPGSPSTSAAPPAAPDGEGEGGHHP